MTLDLQVQLQTLAQHKNKDFIISRFGTFTYLEIQNLIVKLSSFLDKAIEVSQSTEERSIFLVKGDGELAHLVFLLAALNLEIPFIPMNRTWERSETLPFKADRIWISCEGSSISIDGESFSILGTQGESDRRLTSHMKPKQRVSSLQKLACCFPTSGTTGQPKMIAVTNHQLAKGAAFVSQALSLNSEDVLAGMLSLDFDYGLNQVLSSLAVGATYVCCQLSSATTEDLERLASQNPTVLATMPFLIETYFSAFSVGNFPTVRLVTSSGGPLTQKHRQKIKRVCPKATIIPMYGLSEGFRATISTAEIDKKYPNSVGIPIGDTEISIRNENGEPLPPNVTGEIWQSGGCLSWGYWNDSVATSNRFIDDSEFPNKRWLKSGDLGVFNNDGILFVLGRVSFQIKKFGLRISIDEVESQISKTLGGVVCVAVPIQVSETESDFNIFVEASEKLLPSLIIKIHTSMPREMWPRRLFCIEKIPLNVYGGKPDRQFLLAISEKEETTNINSIHED